MLYSNLTQHVKLLSISYVTNKLTYLCRFLICRKKHLKCIPSLWITLYFFENGLLDQPGDRMQGVKQKRITQLLMEKVRIDASLLQVKNSFVKINFS